MRKSFLEFVATRVVASPMVAIGGNVNTTVIAPLLMMASLPVMAETINFDQDAVASTPSGWTAGVTGRGTPKWAIEVDPTAPSAPNVLKQSGAGTFPWCVKSGTALTEGMVEVKFKPISGKEDQAGGLVWRWKDGDNYYVARANALENNISLYYTTGGRRNTIKYVSAPVARNVWHMLRVDFGGKRIAVTLDGKTYIDLEDEHIAGPGAVGVWTKADSVTAFTTSLTGRRYRNDVRGEARRTPRRTPLETPGDKP